MQIAVLGGGIAGLTSALAFAKAGASVRVFEQAAELGEVGAGLQITPNGARVLRALGCWDALMARSVAAEAVVPSDALTGRAITRFDLSGYDPAYHFVYRPRLIEVLAHVARAAGVTIELGRQIGDPPGGVDLVVGAEGVRAPSRARLNGAAEPFFTGQVAWRAIVDHPAPPEARIWMAPGRHVVTYPLTGGRLNIVAVQERKDWAAEGWSHADDPANLIAAFPDVCVELDDILRKVRQVNLWGLFRHEVAAQWHDGTCVLVGDAAHPTLPFLAQGANLALEDAYVLARCVKDLGQAEGLERYQDLRRPRVLRAIAAANANAVNYHLAGRKRQIAHLGLKALGTVAPGAFLGRLDWLYGHDVTA